MPFVIPTIFTAVDRFTGPVTKMQGAMVGLTTIAGVEGAKLQRSLAATSSAAMEVATSSGLLAAAILIPLGLATKAAMDFEKEMANVSTLVDTTKESMAAMGDEVLALAAKTPVPIHDLTESLYQLRSEGFDNAVSMTVLGEASKLAVAGLSTATEATKSMATAMRVFADEGMTAHQIANTFFQTVATGRTTMAQINESFGENAAIVHSAGVSFIEFQAATAALTNGGLTASTAQTDLAQATLALIKPTGEMITILQKLGYSGAGAGQQLIRASHGAVPAILAINDAAARTGTSIEKAFGRKQGLIANELLTHLLNPQFNKDYALMNKGAEALDTAYQKQLGTTAAQSQIAKNNLETLGIRIGELLLPILTPLVKALGKVVGALADFAHAHKTLAGIIVGGIGIFGTFFAIVASGALAIWAVTKSILVWKGALAALNIVQSLAVVRTAFLSASIWAQVGVIGLLSGALAFAVMALFSYGGANDKISEKIDSMNDNLGESTDKFHKITEPINEATIALLKYNEAVDDYNKRQSALSLEQYDMKQRGSNSVDFWDWSPTTINREFDAAYQLAHPEIPTLPAGFDSTKVQMQFINSGGYSQPTAPTNPQAKPMAETGDETGFNYRPSYIGEDGSLHITLDNNSGAPATIKSAGFPIDVRINSGNGKVDKTEMT